MWPFAKREAKDSSIPKRELEQLFDSIAQKWLVFERPKEDVTLEQRVKLFLKPAIEGLMKARPEIALLPPEVVMLIFANGLQHEGTHHPLEIQDALGIPRSGEVPLN